MKYDDALYQVSQYFSDKLAAYGPTAKGVDYNSKEAQEIRFEQLVRLFDLSRHFSVIDFGCGYGAMFDFFNRKNLSFQYYGFDMNDQMILAGRKIHQRYVNCFFTTCGNEIPTADYVVAGSIFNIKLEAPEDDWRQHSLQTLREMNRHCTKGFSFNMLTSYSDPDRMKQRPDLFYADPCFYFDYCKRNFSRNVALLHDYELFDFTIVVRKDT
jgi:SAM-dependent methyltransferase